jgi:hypothetical protein
MGQVFTTAVFRQFGPPANKQIKYLSAAKIVKTPNSGRESAKTG